MFKNIFLGLLICFTFSSFSQEQNTEKENDFKNHFLQKPVFTYVSEQTLYKPKERSILKTNPDISVNLLLLGKQTFEGEESEPHEEDSS